MALALYAPGLGYYSAGARKFGSEGDFTTAPELTPVFAQVIARTAATVLAQTEGDVLEFGAGSGKLACDLLQELERLERLPYRYLILEVSADLRERQRELMAATVPRLLPRVRWLDTLPQRVSGFILANEVLDVLPVHLIAWTDAGPRERGVICREGRFTIEDREIESATLLREIELLSVDAPYMSEVAPAVNAFVASVAQALERGAMLFVDYGFARAEYYHAQRRSGTLLCHYRHRAHADPLYLPGLCDITAHVDFTRVAEAAVAQGARLAGYSTQAAYLLDAGLADVLARYDPRDAARYLAVSNAVQRLVNPAEMGELFKAIAFCKALSGALPGFTRSRQLAL